MKALPASQSAAALTLPEIDALVAEIADHQLTCEGLRADLRARFRAAARPDIERVRAALAAVEKSLDERWRVAEAWATAHQAACSERPRSRRRRRGVIGQEGPDAFGKEAR